MVETATASVDPFHDAWLKAPIMQSTVLRLGLQPRRCIHPRLFTRFIVKMSDAPYTESWLAGPRNTKFYTRQYTPTSPPKALLVFMHGFIEHIGRYEHVFPYWKNRGIAVFSFDQRGFGRTAEDKQHRSKDSSYGKTSGEDQVKDCEWAIKAARDGLDGVPTFLMGHSMVRAIKSESYPIFIEHDI